jgi:hypothetical protein
MKNKRKKRQRRPWHGVWGRKPKSGVLSGITPDETLDELLCRITYDSPEWRMRALQDLIKNGSQLPSNYLSAPRDVNCSPYTERHPSVFPLWNDLCVQFERAVLNGDADWFRRQWKSFLSVQSQEKTGFNKKVVFLLEQAMWERPGRRKNWRPLTKAERKALPEAFRNLRAVPQVVTLSPAGKSTDKTASDIYNCLDVKRDEDGKISVDSDGKITVECCKFESKKRAMDAIHDIAKRLQFKLKKQKRPVSDASAKL